VPRGMRGEAITPTAQELAVENVGVACHTTCLKRRLREDNDCLRNPVPAMMRSRRIPSPVLPWR
jgi:hypothetical protein